MGKSLGPLVPDSVFVHPPLNLHERTIRTLKVLPHRKGQIVQCRMEVARPEEEHIALSYVWGSDEPLNAINIDGKRFMVRRNLASFLEWASHHLPDCTLWIDAICVDQNNIPERNHQVRYMIELYRCARLVLIWLGPQQMHVGRLLDCLETLYADDPFSQSRFSIDTSSTAKTTMTRITEASMASIVSVCNADYWTRLWIVPEVLSARDLNLACPSGYLLPWYRLRKFIGAVSHQEPSAHSLVANFTIKDSKLAAFLRLRQSHERKYTFLDLVREYGTNLCLDLRDRVFALIALSSDMVKNLKVDYSMSVEGLYILMVSMTGLYDESSLKLAKALLDILEIDLNTELVDRLLTSVMSTWSGSRNTLDISDTHWLLPMLCLRPAEFHANPSKYEVSCLNTFAYVAAKHSIGLAIELIKSLDFTIEDMWQSWPSFGLVATSIFLKSLKFDKGVKFTIMNGCAELQKLRLNRTRATLDWHRLKGLHVTAIHLGAMPNHIFSNLNDHSRELLGEFDILWQTQVELRRSMLECFVRENNSSSNRKRLRALEGIGLKLWLRRMYRATRSNWVPFAQTQPSLMIARALGIEILRPTMFDHSVGSNAVFGWDDLAWDAAIEAFTFRPVEGGLRAPACSSESEYTEMLIGFGYISIRIVLRSCSSQEVAAHSKCVLDNRWYLVLGAYRSRFHPDGYLIRPDQFTPITGICELAIRPNGSDSAESQITIRGTESGLVSFFCLFADYPFEPPRGGRPGIPQPPK